MTSIMNVVQLPVSRPSDTEPDVARAAAGRQLCLFDVHEVPLARSPVTAVCVPMQEIHGRRFHVLLGMLKATIVVDLRKFPTFRLIASESESTLRAIRRQGCHYHNRPLDLAEPRDKADEWRQVREIVLLSAWLERKVDHSSVRALFLVHRTPDRENLERNLTSVGRRSSFNWSFLDLNAPDPKWVAF